MDDDVIEQHGCRYVIYHPSQPDPEHVPLFPAGLAPGRYRVRPVMTHPVSSGVYTKDESISIIRRTFGKISSNPETFNVAARGIMRPR